MTPLERLKGRISRTGDINDAATARSLLSLEEFFVGNGNSVFHAVEWPASPTIGLHWTRR